MFQGKDYGKGEQEQATNAFSGWQPWDSKSKRSVTVEHKDVVTSCILLFY
jgi:hypothetical protein